MMLSTNNNNKIIERPPSWPKCWPIARGELSPTPYPAPPEYYQYRTSLDGRENATPPSQEPACMSTIAPLFPTASGTYPLTSPTKMPLFWLLSLILRIVRSRGSTAFNRGVAAPTLPIHYWDCGRANITNNHQIHSGPSGAYN